MPATSPTPNNDMPMASTAKPTRNRRMPRDGAHITGNGSNKTLSWRSIALNCTVRFAMWSLFAYILCLSVVDVQSGKELFSWHPPLLTLALLLMSESMLCFADTNLATYQLQFATKVRLHWLLQTAAAVVAAAGFVVVCVHKLRNDKTHFGTWHAQYGLAALLAMLATGAAGVAAKYAVAWRHRWRPVTAKIVHAALALFNYKLMVLAAVLALWSSWFGKHGTPEARYVCAVAMGAVAVYVAAMPTRTLAGRVRSAWLGAYAL